MRGGLLVAIILIAVSSAGLLLSRNAIKTVMALTIAESAVILIAVIGAYREGAGAALTHINSEMVNPLPQALVLTAIVIGASTTALALSVLVKLFHHTGSVDLDQLRRLRG